MSRLACDPIFVVVENFVFFARIHHLIGVPDNFSGQDQLFIEMLLTWCLYVIRYGAFAFWSWAAWLNTPINLL